MKRIGIVATAVVALALSPAALAAGGITGKYKTKIKSGQLAGTWVVHFAKSGTYTVAGDGETVVRGKYSTSGAKLTLGRETGALACASTGKYTYKRKGKTLKLTRVSDSACTGRASILAHTFTKVS